MNIKNFKKFAKKPCNFQINTNFQFLFDNFQKEKYNNF